MKTEKLMVQESENGPMAQSIQGSLKKGKNMGMENIFPQQGKNILEIGHIIKEMVKNNLKIFKKIVFLYFSIRKR